MLTDLSLIRLDRLFAVILEGSALALETGLNLSLELINRREVGYSGSAGALRVSILVGFFVLDNLFPICAGQEHEVKLVLVFTSVRLLDRKTGLTFFLGASCRLEIGALLANRVGKVGLETVFLIRVEDFRQLLALEATLEEVLLGKKIATLAVDRIAEVLLLARQAGVS